jgi:hypothetical protein
MCQENVTTVGRKLNGEHLPKVNGYSVIKHAIPISAKTNYLLKNNMLIKVSSKKGNQSGYIRPDTANLTPNELHTSKLADMHENVMPKVHTLLKNGRNSKGNMNIDAFIAKNERNSPKTILSPYQKEAQITLRTFSRFAEIATVVSGRSFNIYENPELIK